MFPPAIRKALAISAHRRTGTIEDVEHIVILMQENRSFDHNFGALAGVRGFGDRLPIPIPDSDGIAKKTIWYQNNGGTGPAPRVVPPFRLNTQTDFELMRVTGTPHGLFDAEHAWGDWIMNQWPRYKNATRWATSPRTTSLSSSPWPRRSPSATTTTARS
jgi:phospholipase C